MLSFVGDGRRRGASRGTPLRCPPLWTFVWTWASIISAANANYVGDHMPAPGECATTGVNGTCSSYLLNEARTQGYVRTLAGRPEVCVSVDGANTSASFGSPEGMVIATDGTMYISDTEYNCIRKISALYRMVSTLAGSCDSNNPGFKDGRDTVARFDKPHGLTLDEANNYLYVADKDNRKIRRVDVADGANGTVTTVASSYTWSYPRDVAMSEENALPGLYVADTNAHMIRFVNVTSGEVTDVVGTGSPGAADGAALSGASVQYVRAMDATDQYLYFVQKHMLRQLDLTSRQVLTLAGSENSGHEDGYRSAATFYEPNDLYADPSGDVYIADRQHGLLRVYQQGGNVTTVMGSPADGFQGVTGDGFPDRMSTISISGVDGNGTPDLEGRVITVLDAEMCVVMQVSSACKAHCEHGGNCSSSNTCDCEFGWEDGLLKDCSIPICNETCPVGQYCSGPNTCQCETGWEGTNCTTPICSQTCRNNATCTGPDWCSCKAGWGAFDCGTAICTQICMNDAPCSLPDFCDCQIGWTGHTCELPACFVDVCMNNSTCAAPEHCDCGDALVVVDPQTVTYPNLGTTFTLAHTFGGQTLMGYNDSGSCVTPICDPPCQNGGVCVDPFTCNCTTWETGEVSTNGIESGPYLGMPKYRGPLCEQPICHHGICEHSGNCNSPNSCSCTDTDGWANGDLNLCEVPLCGTVVCKNGGECAAPDLCNCTYGWTDSNCSTPTCYGVDSGSCRPGTLCTGPDDCTTACASVTCNNNGTCSGIDQCSCVNMWQSSETTQQCAYAECQIATGANANQGPGKCPFGCLNGTCDSPGECTCDPGWDGQCCSDAICTGELATWFSEYGWVAIECQNQGFCSKPGECTCVGNWAGADCTTPLCPDVTCAPNGACTDPNTCTCVGGWIGDECDIPDCNPACLNEGICTDQLKCQCAENFIGAACETEVFPIITTWDQYGGVIIIGCIITGTLCFVYGCWKARRFIDKERYIKYHRDYEAAIERVAKEAALRKKELMDAAHGLPVGMLGMETSSSDEDGGGGGLKAAAVGSGGSGGDEKAPMFGVVGAGGNKA